MRYTPAVSRKTDTFLPYWALGTLTLACLFGAGCATVPVEPPPSYDELADQAYETVVDVDEVIRIKRAFLATPDFDERMRAVTLLEDQVDVLMEQPLRLGSIGSAILDHYRASLPGHRALAKFYRHVDVPEQAAIHDAWLEAISTAIESGGVGTAEAPYVALSSNEAEAFLKNRGRTPVGSTYRETREHPLMLWVTAGREDGPVENVHFDLGDLYSTIAESVVRKPTTVFPVGPPVTCEILGICDGFNPWAFISVLARGDDPAAQTAIGFIRLAHWNDLDQAAQWLSLASRSGNAMANLLLAQGLRDKAADAAPDARKLYQARAEQQFLVAVQAGFDEAMLDLGLLYLQGIYGEDKMPRGRHLIERAAEFNNTTALLELGRLHAVGTLVERDHGLAAEYFLRAAEQNEEGKVQYAWFLMRPEVEQGFNARAYRWLRQVANNDNPRAMVLIGDLYAKGLHVGKSFRRALSWFKNAVETAPDDPELVNEVAWRLTVTHLPKLRDERYALLIMERIMEESEDARLNHAYLDTWAAAYAANGDFERAITVQKQAIERAESVRANDLPILVEHLEAFRAGKEISEQVP